MLEPMDHRIRSPRLDNPLGSAGKGPGEEDEPDRDLFPA